MRFKMLKAVVLVLILAVLASVVPGCSCPTEAIESYIGVVPKVLHSGAGEAVSLTLFKGENLISGKVEVALLKDGKEIVGASRTIQGKGSVVLDIPDVEEGEYEIRLKGNGFEDRTTVRVERSFLVFVETDKPIYKPGQTMHLRLITLDAELRPVSELSTVEILDAKGIKIFRREVNTDEYGMVTLDLPISGEPNLGVWKITAVTDKGRAQLDVRVEEYVLPKYEVKVELPKEWFLADEPVAGRVTAEYSFGKPVSGELEIIASRYVGEWEQYATFSKEIDGETEFELPAVGYVAGVPAASGMGNVMLEVAVKERATGYEEKSSKLLTVAQTPVNLQIIPEGSVFKPGLPFSFLVVSETPDNQPVETTVKLTVTYLNDELDEEKEETKEVNTTNGKAVVELTPPDNGVVMIIDGTAEGAQASRTVPASYSPSGNFIHLEQISEGIPQIGEEVIFRVYSTREAANFYYEVVSRNRVVFTDFATDDEISFVTTPLMAPASRLLVYQILPNSEVAADFIPFDVEAEYPHLVNAEFSEEEARPGEEIDINIETEGQARVGIVAVDKSVFILAENRLNLQQVFDELERLYMEPQAELHEVSIYPVVETKGAREIFDDAGVVVLSNNKVPEGKDYQWEDQPNFWEGLFRFLGGGGVMEEAGMAPPGAPKDAQLAADDDNGTAGLAEVERIRQYFPETWLWEVVDIGAGGKVSLPVVVPDSITTWMLRAVALSKEKGLGVTEDELRAFQPFFVTIDLPYSAIRGEEFPVRVAIYNYLDKPQSVLVQIDDEGWFDLLDDAEKTVDIDANDIGGAEFMIRPNGLGINELKITVRSQEAADAMIKTLIVVPEGVPREVVENLVISGGDTRVVETSIPPFAVADSGRAYLALTSSYMTQTIDGLEELIQMPFGCGEQNMMMFTPDVYITKYLKESGQLKPEIMAKAEKLMITGYQRELTYRRGDGSFSAFGQSDDKGSLWLTAFVLKSFAEAVDIMYIDDSVLDEAEAWITAQQNSDGSFDPVGFVHHQEMIGGLHGKTALTAFVAIALMEAGEKTSSARAVDYLEGELDGIDDAYTAAITAYALGLAGSGKSEDSYSLLMELAEEDEDGLHWSTGGDILPEQPTRFGPGAGQSADIEATAYATLALIKNGDAFNASRAAKWLVSRRNAYGGFGSTQDTVMALQALTEYATDSRADVDLVVAIEGGGEEKEIRINQENYDVLQIVEVPVGETVEISVAGEGEAIAQVVRRYNLPEAEETGEEILKVDVDYDTTQVEVDDLVRVSVDLEFAPPLPMEAGMVVLDISVPTGFEPVVDTIAAIVEKEDKIKRYEIAGRKVIFYIENMLSGDSIYFSFNVKAMYPVKARGVTSEAYSYYKPEIRGETLSEDITVR
jgi:CD109 antigen